MKTFEGITFCGTFRDYQQNVLSNIDTHIQDKKVHIVAAPGSGKTILGLELIRRLNAPALILSPSVTIRQQWGERFSERFLPDGENLSDYVSFRLQQPELLTSVTYQSIHSAWNRIPEKPDLDDADDEAGSADYTGFDLIQTIKDAGIRTICLDEAHHLKSEWQRALEAFIEAVQGEILIIALTATPPYDSAPAEWNRYTALCGEIDEEIGVPELVVQNTLCPHQDYIYFNDPTKDEMDSIMAYKQCALDVTEDVMTGGLLSRILEAGAVLTSDDAMDERILDNAAGYIALLVLAQHKGIPIPRRTRRLFSPRGTLPAFKLSFAETAFQFVLDNPALFSDDTAEELKKMLSTRGLMERRRVCLQTNTRLSRLLVSSIGKLDSIAKIAAAESAGMGDHLRMLVLTDYIKKDLLRIVGTTEKIGMMGTVTVFESIRRIVGGGVRTALLSGGLVILPNDTIEAVKALCDARGIRMSARALPGTNHSEVSMPGANKHKVAIITEIFQRGNIHILVGTKALLGEGWDSPCINSLILASFVGSFVLSNQMRGRAIRIDKDDPQKTANIWHLVTVEPPANLKERLQDVTRRMAERDRIMSADFDTLERRFDCFLAPAYHKNVVRSGIDRVDILKPPYTREKFASINRQMLELSARRDDLRAKWDAALCGTAHPEILSVSEAPPSVMPTGFVFNNVLYVVFLLAMATMAARIIIMSTLSSGRILAVAAGVVIVILAFRGVLRLIRFISPKKTIQTLAGCVLSTLVDIGLVRQGACVRVKSDPLGTSIHCSITNATRREKQVFADAIKELLTYIDNPRYVLVKKGRLLFWTFSRYTQSYACPSVIGVKQEYAATLAAHVKRVSGAFACVYTRSEKGRRELLKCRRRSYINMNEIHIKGRKIAKSRWE